MNDSELLAAFESCQLPHNEWTHTAHVRVAYMYANKFDLLTATDTVRLRIQTYNKATDTPEAIDRGYHETITRAFMQLVFAAVAETGPHSSSVEFCKSHPELMDKKALLNYYSRDRIMSWEAKREFIEPDLQPLPFIPHGNDEK